MRERRAAARARWISMPALRVDHFRVLLTAA
jgi:hypothetical protein